MHPVERELLSKLLRQADRSGRPSIPVNERSAAAYFQSSDPAERERIDSGLTNAEAVGAISLDWGRGAACRDLIRIRLIDADRLADYLGEARAGTFAAEIERRLRPLLTDAPDWLRAAFAQALSHWQRGQRAFGIQPRETEIAERLFRIALAVSRGEQQSLDLRRFSVRLLGDSKAVERQLNRLAELLRHNPHWAELTDNDELFQILGLQKFPPAVFVKGPLLVRYGAQQSSPASDTSIDWDLSALRPFVALAPDAVAAVRTTRPPRYVLTIENLASFQRHVRELLDDAIVLYTAGFPAPALANFIRRIDEALPESIPFFHWGDRDPGGLRIFAAVAQACPRHPTQAHLMHQATNDSRSFTATERGLLERIATSPGPAAPLARHWLDTGLGRLEQEAIDPMVPAMAE